MVSRVRYTEEFKAEAVKQVLERGFKVVEVAPRIGVPVHTLYGWVQRARRRLASAGSAPTTAVSDTAELRRLKAELRRVTEERDILKKAVAYFAKEQGQSTPSCARTPRSFACARCAGCWACTATATTLGCVRKAAHGRARTSGCWASSGISGWPVGASTVTAKVMLDLREAGERCSRHRVLRLKRLEPYLPRLAGNADVRSRRDPRCPCADQRAHAGSPTQPE